MLKYMPIRGLISFGGLGLSYDELTAMINEANNKLNKYRDR
jgi:hypothetical protein